jgi:hypothetical protein
MPGSSVYDAAVPHLHPSTHLGVAQGGKKPRPQPASVNRSPILDDFYKSSRLKKWELKVRIAVISQLSSSQLR